MMTHLFRIPQFCVYAKKKIGKVLEARGGESDGLDGDRMNLAAKRHKRRKHQD
jgi:hypothetical protein